MSTITTHERISLELITFKQGRQNSELLSSQLVPLIDDSPQKWCEGMKEEEAKAKNIPVDVSMRGKWRRSYPTHPNAQMKISLDEKGSSERPTSLHEVKKERGCETATATK